MLKHINLDSIIIDTIGYYTWDQFYCAWLEDHIDCGSLELVLSAVNDFLMEYGIMQDKWLLQIDAVTYIKPADPFVGLLYWKE